MLPPCPAPVKPPCCHGATRTRSTEVQRHPRPRRGRRGRRTPGAEETGDDVRGERADQGAGARARPPGSCARRRRLGHRDRPPRRRRAGIRSARWTEEPRLDPARSCASSTACAAGGRRLPVRLRGSGRVGSTAARRSSSARCEGRIAEAPRGEGGFGYDPIVVPPEGDGRTFAEMTPDEKQAIGHRTRAFGALRAPRRDSVRSHRRSAPAPPRSLTPGGRPSQASTTSSPSTTWRRCVLARLVRSTWRRGRPATRSPDLGRRRHRPPRT